MVGPSCVLERISSVTPDEVVAFAVLAATMHSVQFHRGQNPWHFRLSAIRYFHRAVVPAIWERITSVVLGAFSLAPLSKEGDSRVRSLHCLFPAATFVLGSLGCWPEGTIVGCSCEENWMLLSKLGEGVWHPGGWERRRSGWSANSWVLSHSKFDAFIIELRVRAFNSTCGSHAVSAIDDVVGVDFMVEVSSFNVVLSNCPVDGFDEVLTVCVSRPPVLITIWTLDVWEHNGETVAGEMLKALAVHTPFASGSVHVTKEREGTFTLWDPSIDHGLVIGHVEELWLSEWTGLSVLGEVAVVPSHGSRNSNSSNCSEEISHT